MLPTGDNPMILRGCHHICHSVDQLEIFVSDIVSDFNESSSEFFTDWARLSDFRLEWNES